MRKRFLQIDGELVEVGVLSGKPRQLPEIMPDIQPYKSMITGETIKSRSQHREHLREHNCQEIGNEVATLTKRDPNWTNAAPQQRHEIIRSQVDALTHREFKAAIKRDADRVKWNSRED